MSFKQWPSILVVLCLWRVPLAATGTENGAIVIVRINTSPSQSTSLAQLVLTAADEPLLDWTAETPAGRRVVFRHVPAGTYEVRVQLAGFHDLVAHVEIQASTTHDLVAVMKSTADIHTISSLELSGTESTANARIFDRDFLETLPGDDVLWSVVETTAASLIADRISNGGLWAGEAARIGGNGTSWRATAITWGDLDVTDSVQTGSTFARANHTPIETLLVSTTSLPASVGGPGPVLTVVPTNVDDWRGSVSAGGIAQALQASGTSNDGAPPIARFIMHRDSVSDIGGRLGKRVDFFGSAQSAASNRVERSDPTVLSTTVASVFAGANVTVGARNRLRISPSLNRGTTPYSGRARFQDRRVQQRSVFETLQSSWDHWTASGTAWSVSAGFQNTHIDPPTGNGLQAGAGAIERLREGPVSSLFLDGPGTRRRWNSRIEAEPTIDTRHLIALGVNIERSVAVGQPMAAPPVAELVNGLPARVWQYAYAGGHTHWSSTEAAVYASDQIDLPFRVRADVGARLDTVRGSARAAANAISWVSLVPRLNARWLIDEKGRFALSGGYARYAHHLPLDYFAYGDPAAASGRVYRWTDANGDHQFTDSETGALIAAVGPCCSDSVLNQIDPRLQRPYTNELFASVDGRLKGWSVRIAVVDRRERSLVGAENAGVTSADYTVRYIPDPGGSLSESIDDQLLPVYDRDAASFGKDRYLLTNPPGHDADYLGLEVTVDRQIIHGLRTRFDGALYAGEARGSNRGYGPVENDPGTVGELFTNPNADTFARGHQFFDRAYVMKWWAAYAAPKHWLVSAVARYQDGQPFSRMVIVPDLNQGPEAVQAYRRGRTRFTFTLTIDAHVEKSWNIGRVNASGILEIFNLLNTRNEVEEDVVTGPAFRTTTAIQPPRAGRVAVRLRF